MKSFLFSLLLVPSLCLAQQHDLTPSYIAGHIEGATATTLRLIVEDDPYLHLDKPTSYPIAVDSKGHFALSLNFKHAQKYVEGILFYPPTNGMIFLCLRPRDSLILQTSHLNFEAPLRVEGSNAVIYHYKQKDYLYKQKDYLWWVMHRPTQPLPCLKLLQNVVKKRLIFLEAYRQKQSLPEDFVQYQRKVIHYDFAQQINMCPEMSIGKDTLLEDSLFRVYALDDSNSPFEKFLADFHLSRMTYLYKFRFIH